MRERYEVARVKTDTIDRREINSVNGSKNIAIYLVRLSDEGWEQEKGIRQEPSNPIWTAYGLAIYLAMPKRSVAAAPNITIELTKIDNKLT